MLTEAQKRAMKKWEAKNKDKRKKITYESHTRVFIKEIANLDDLVKIEELISQRRYELSN